MLNNSCEVLKDIPANDLNASWSDSSVIMSFDHVNINTKYLKETIKFYEILGFIAGPRPEFSFNGAWLYLDLNIHYLSDYMGYIPYPQSAYIHLVEVSAETFTFSSGTIDHIAFRCDVKLLKETQNLLEYHKISYKYNRVLLEEGNNEKSDRPNAIDQLFIYDPNEIKVELNFRK